MVKFNQQTVARPARGGPEPEPPPSRPRTATAPSKISHRTARRGPCVRGSQQAPPPSKASRPQKLSKGHTAHQKVSGPESSRHPFPAFLCLFAAISLRSQASDLRFALVPQTGLTLSPAYRPPVPVWLWPVFRLILRHSHFILSPRSPSGLPSAKALTLFA
jgi:hypothetical protein